VFFFAHIPFVVNRVFQRNASGVVATILDKKHIGLLFTTKQFYLILMLINNIFNVISIIFNV